MKVQSALYVDPPNSNEFGGFIYGALQVDKKVRQIHCSAHSGFLLEVFALVVGPPNSNEFGKFIYKT